MRKPVAKPRKPPSSKDTRARQELLFGDAASNADANPRDKQGERAAPVVQQYDPASLEDAANDLAGLSGAFGILTWSTWDLGLRPFEERVKDFVMAFPPEDPLRYSQGGMRRTKNREWQARIRADELDTFINGTGGVAGIDRCLMQFGLKRRGTRTVGLPKVEPKEQLQAMRDRNRALRVLHGSVDIEAADMNAAKEAFLETQEKRRAAQQVRQARLARKGRT